MAQHLRNKLRSRHRPVEVLIGFANVVEKGSNAEVEQKPSLGFRAVELEEVAPVLSPTSIEAKNLHSSLFRVAQMLFQRELFRARL